jgi:hypothetical protein
MENLPVHIESAVCLGQGNHGIFVVPLRMPTYLTVFRPQLELSECVQGTVL